LNIAEEEQAQTHTNKPIRRLHRC